MTRIFIPAEQPDDWQRFLAEPALQWKTGYSARTLAHCWHAADGFPAEIDRVLAASPVAAFHGARPLLILPEYKAALKGHGPASQNDVFVLAKATDGALMAITIEGKVEESFGTSLGTWKAANQGFTDNKRTRLDDLLQHLGLPDVPDAVYYQLLHRTASAVIEARTFNAPHAVMLVHSFSPAGSWFEEFARFVGLYGVAAEKDALHHLTTVAGVDLYAGWITGNARFLSM